MMATVNIEITGNPRDVMAALAKIDNALSITHGERDTAGRILHADGSMTLRVAANADESPGGADEFEFSRNMDADTYPDLFLALKQVLMQFNRLEQSGVVKQRVDWLQHLRVFHDKLGEYIDSSSE